MRWYKYVKNLQNLTCSQQGIRRGRRSAPGGVARRAGLVVGGVAALVGAGACRGSAEPQRWADARACLVGEALVAGESLESRLRGIEIAFGARAGACLAKRDA
ncbi:MAG: hypothetical protein IT373_26145, partial [Polyangiaceae bacterium]|nr:hypothetical protein [Polyangiaceae bacterium]